MPKVTTLKTGLRVLTIPQKSTRTVTVLVLVGTGSKYEEKRTNGVSHFLEHMFFKGTKKRPGPLEIASPIENVGGTFNAFTTQDLTGYYVKLDAAHLNLALDIVADIFLNSLFPAREIQKEKGVVVEEINMRKDAPMIHVSDLWDQVLYGDQPAGWDIAGTKETVMGLSRKDIVSYMKSQYVAKNTLVCVAGNMDERKLLSKAPKLFSGISTKDFKHKLAVKEEQEKPNVVVEYRKTDQTHLALGARAYPLTHKDRFAQDLLAVILGEGMSSRLFYQVRERLGLAYYISTSSEKNPDAGSIVTVAGVKNEYAAKAIQAIMKEYLKVTRVPVSAKELREAKDRVRGKMAIALEPSDAKAEFYGIQEMLEGRFFTLQELYDRIEKVTVKDIQLAAQDIFQPSHRNLVLVGPFKDYSQFQALLK